MCFRIFLCVAPHRPNSSSDANIYPDLTTIIDELTEIEIDYNKGLPAMLKKKYLDDAFVLHDRSSVQKKHFCTEEIANILKRYQVRDDPDDFAKLYSKWAQLRRMLCFQPLNTIRDYFGEMNAMYFAWLGTFLATLALPAFLGLVFFAIGQILSLQNSTSLLSLNYVNYLQPKK